MGNIQWEKNGSSLCSTISEVWFSFKPLKLRWRNLDWSPFIGMEVEVLVAQLCPTLYDPMDYSPPGSSVSGIL